MSKKFTAVAVTALFALSACGGGGSGVNKNTQIGDMSDDEKTQVCEWIMDLDVDYSTCGTSVSSSGTSLGECTEQFDLMASCDLTVGEVEECYVAIADDPCSAALPTECASYFTCLLTAAFGAY